MRYALGNAGGFEKQLEDYEQLCRDRNNGRLLTPDGMRFICEANNYDPEAIGRHFLEVLAKIQQQIYSHFGGIIYYDEETAKGAFQDGRLH